VIISAKELLLRAQQFANDDSRRSAEFLFEIRRNFSDAPKGIQMIEIALVVAIGLVGST